MKIERKVTFERNGKTVRRTVRANSEAEFNEKYNAILAQAAKESRTTFEKISEEWEEQHFKNIAYGTQVCYTPALKRAREAFADMALEDIQPGDVKRLLDSLAMQKYSAKTVKMQKVVIGLIYKYAIVNGYANSNPAEYVPLPKHLAVTERTPPSENTISIIKQNVSAPFGLFPLFLLYTGCRRGEALGVQWSDIDFENNTIHIQRNIIFQNNRAIVKNHLKTKSGMRTIPLLSPLRAALQAQKKQSVYIFANDDGTLLSETQFNHRIEFQA